MTKSASQGETTYTGDPICTCGQSFTAGFQPWCPVHDGSALADRRRGDDLITGRRLPPARAGHIKTWDDYMTPEPKAQKCPVCEGEGKLPDYGSTNITKTCHGCEGKGWVVC